MHYHLYKNPNENKVKAKFRLLSSVLLNVSLSLIENSVIFAKDIKDQIKLDNINLPKIALKNIDFRNIDIKNINLNQLDKITASILIIAAGLYFSVNVPNKVETSMQEAVHEIAAPAPIAATPAIEKIEIIDNAPEKTVEVVKEKPLDFASRLIPSFAPTEEELFIRKVKKVRDTIAAMIEREARMAPKSKIVKVSRGDTLVGLLVNKANISRRDAFQTVEALKPLYDPRNIAPGNEITVFFHKDPAIAGENFSGIKIDKDIINSVTVKKLDSGEYKARQSVKNVHKMVHSFKGVINNSLYLDAAQVGIPDYIIADLIKMYSWNVDFQRDIRKGNKFELMFEEFKTDDGKTVTNKAKIIYANLGFSRYDLPYYRFTDKDGFVDFYDDHGNSAKKVLMKTPINGARLTSSYGMRKHPVLGYSKLHKGIDFAAPIGTPIYASGNGTIEKAQWWSSFGNYVRIRHKNGLKTAYAHMKAIKSGIRKGVKVRQGEVIGYLGNTGRSTGPHLHYEIHLNGRQVNPRSLKLPTGNQLRGKDLKRFKKVMESARANFRNITYQNEVADNILLSGKKTTRN